MPFAIPRDPADSCPPPAARLSAGCPTLARPSDVQVLRGGPPFPPLGRVLRAAFALGVAMLSPALAVAQDICTDPDPGHWRAGTCPGWDRAPVFNPITAYVWEQQAADIMVPFYNQTWVLGGYDPYPSGHGVYWPTTPVTTSHMGVRWRWVAPAWDAECSEHINGCTGRVDIRRFVFTVPRGYALPIASHNDEFGPDYPEVGGGSSGGGSGNSCRSEVWEISYDGGLSWSVFATVEVCADM